MRKRVTFDEHLKKENQLKNDNGLSELRSSGFHHRFKNGFECLTRQQVSEGYRGTRANASPDSQHMRTIHVPKSVMTAPFLQHPSLTTGQRRYLGSIANIYSTAHMRRQMKQQYLSVLHTCIQTGQSSTCRRIMGDHLRKEQCIFKADTEKDVGPRPKPQRQRKSGAAHTDVILPKIVK